MRLNIVIAASVVALGAATWTHDATAQGATSQATTPAPPASSTPAKPCPTGPTLQEGVVRFFNERMGYGFITPVKGGDEVFVHHSALGTLRIKENDRVVFEVSAGRNGPVAANINLCE
jgi:CspA family cold shock protein